MRRSATFLLLLLIFIVASASIGFAREPLKSDQTHLHPKKEGRRLSDRPLDQKGLFASAQVDTYLLAEYEFDVGGLCDAEGWTSVDLTEEDVKWHVDTYRVIGGSQSLWCGLAPSVNQEPACAYATLPGYGDAWDQYFESVWFDVVGDVNFSFETRYDMEPDYDYFYLEYRDEGDTLWKELFAVDGTWEGPINETILAADHGGEIKLRFFFQSDFTWSDEDGLYDSQGAVILDDMVVEDATGIVDSQDFESELIGDTSTSDGDWNAGVPPAFGDFAGLFRGVTVLQEDVCAFDFSCLWGFFKGSTDTYACGGHPLVPAVPYGPNGHDPPFITNDIWSPWIEWNPGGLIPTSAARAKLDFWVYRDLSLDALIFYMTRVRSKVGEDGCPTFWEDREHLFYGTGKDWYQSIHEMGDLILPGATHVQFAIGCVDMCDLWCGIYGVSPCHSQAPLIDHVKIYRVNLAGPIFTVYDHQLFQDNFAEDGTLTGTVRMDMATDMSDDIPTSIHPGDSVVFKVRGAGVDLGVEPYLGTGRQAVYAYVKATPPMHNTGAPMGGDPVRWPYIGPAGDGWHQFLCDTIVGGHPVLVVGQFCFDLNDAYFTPPDRIDFYFGATDANSFTTYWSTMGPEGGTSDEQEIRDNCEEVQCLPTGESDILYVDDFNNYGAQPYFDTALWEMGISPVDRFDVRGPESRVGNGLGSRAVATQVVDVYKTIIWNSGDLENGTIGDGTMTEKSPDAQLLCDFLEQSSVWNPGVYISGDDVADEIESIGSTPYLQLQTYIPFVLLSGDHRTAGHQISPMVIGNVPGTIFYYWFSDTWPDTMYAYGGCPVINDFDVLEPVGTSTLEMYYDPTTTNGAVISNETINAEGKIARVVLSGFSYHTIRDNIPWAWGLPKDRIDHLTKILQWFDHTLPQVTGVGDRSAYTNSLAQNYPNPFNPLTTIRFSLKDRAHVSLNVYNVAGQLVRTLLSEEREAGVYTDVKWDGRNARGEEVSSGVYFYKLVTKGFNKTKKMVLLK